MHLGLTGKLGMCSVAGGCKTARRRQRVTPGDWMGSIPDTPLALRSGGLNLNGCRSLRDASLMRRKDTRLDPTGFDCRSGSSSRLPLAICLQLHVANAWQRVEQRCFDPPITHLRRVAVRPAM